MSGTRLTTWNYRVLRHEDGSLALHEVYYDDTGRPVARTERPVGFGADADEGIDGLLQSLRMALCDAQERPVLDVSEIGKAVDRT